MRRSIVFWNVERLFAGTPSSLRTELSEGDPDEWTTRDATNKINNLRAVIRAITEQHGAPLILGLAEVETTSLARRLGQSLPTGLTSIDDIAADASFFALDGINIGLLYDEDFFDGGAELRSHVLDRTFDTRDILECRLHSSRLDHPMTVFVNHWPSRLASEGEEKRVNAGHYLRSAMRDILRYPTSDMLDSRGRIKVPAKRDLEARADLPVIAMGDFNDEPFDPSVEILNSTPVIDDVSAPLAVRGRARIERFRSYRGAAVRMFNPFWQFSDGESGSYYRSPRWRAYDQIMLSRGLLDESAPLSFVPGSAQCWSDPSLADGDRRLRMTNRGGKPNKYNRARAEGCSDHFPVLIEVEI